MHEGLICRQNFLQYSYESSHKNHSIRIRCSFLSTRDGCDDHHAYSGRNRSASAISL